jgi:hypothetical protein
MDQRQYEVMLADAELRLRRLRTLYDHWFHGIERLEPQQQRGEVDRIIQELRRQPQRNTALRFRFNQLVQRYTTFNTYWQRIARQIEEGTYKRDVLRAKRRIGTAARDNGRDSQASARETDQDLDMDVDVDVDAALAALKTDPPPAATAAAESLPARSSSPPPGERVSPPPRAITPFAQPTAAATALGARPLPTAARGAAATLQGVGPRKPGVVVPGAPPLPPPIPVGASKAPVPPPPLGLSRAPGPLPAPARVASIPHAPVPRSVPSSGNSNHGNGMSEAQIARIYERYVEARRQNAERTDNVRIETVAKTVRDMLPKLTEKHAGKSIDFEVVLKDGRVALKPVAK